MDKLTNEKFYTDKNRNMIYTLKEDSSIEGLEFLGQGIQGLENIKHEILHKGLAPWLTQASEPQEEGELFVHLAKCENKTDDRFEREIDIIWDYEVDEMIEQGNPPIFIELF